MDEPRPFYRDPKIQAILVVLIAASIYLFTLGRQGAAREVLLADEYAYVSVSSDGGVRILRVQNTVVPVEVGYYDTPGSAQSLALQPPYLYVADGRRGLRILSLLNPSFPVEVSAIELPGETLDVAVTSRFAYLAQGDAGVSVVDISNPSAPSLIHLMDTPGQANAVLAVENVALPSGEGSQVLTTLVYVADGDSGLGVYNFLNPSQPAPITQVDTDGEALDLVLDGGYLYLADGREGVKIFSAGDPLFPALVGVYNEENPAVALDVFGAGLYVAEGSQGFTVLNVSDPQAPQPAIQVDTPGEALAIAAKDNLVYVAEGSQGLRIYDVASPPAPSLVAIYETPGEASFNQLLGGLWAIARGRGSALPTKFWRTTLLIGFDLVLFFVVLFFWLAFFAQFVLPVHKLSDRGKVISRLLVYLTGGHGPAIIIRDGKVKQRTGEARRRGPGVALFDTASGGVFRNPHMFTQVSGPGLAFTEPPEYLAGTVDLHPQGAGIGPLEGEDPFAPQQEDETDDDYGERQDRRFDTSALTRDGVEVVPNVWVAFRLDSEPRQGMTQFGYDPEAVWRAVAGEGVNPDAAAGSDNRQVPWTWLPVRIAADLWREYLRKYALDELFTLPQDTDPPVAPENRRTAYDRIVEMVKNRMLNPQVEALDEFGRPLGRLEPSKEYALLAERGIRVLSAGIRNLRFPRVVEETILEQWQATWMERAQREAREIDRLHMQVKGIGQELALMEFAAAASQRLGRELLQKPSGGEYGLRQTLERLLDGTLRLTIHETELQPRLTNQRGLLVEMIEWVRKQTGKTA